ncbi:zinc-binding alcohol dehydrogenase family protein [Mucilaginibacter angelicae]|uniref:Zinc-binding alcohol dehydrogenase family protein n=1 Tax=Mucilaginibacter angelicae TaxID=869718 RepID=A0ABV6L2F6_9SPHI
MKAAVLYQTGNTPIYDDFAEPTVNAGEQVITVTAASIKNLDKMRAKGSHYDTYTNFPAVVGVDGVGVLPDGTRVYTGSRTGMMAEKAVAGSKMMVPLPQNLDDVTAAAIANPAVSAWLSLAWKGGLQKGGSVLILGATGITGKLAVQLAKHMGAARIVATGRNPEALKVLTTLGADVTISLNQPEDQLRQAISAEIKKAPFDIVLDYLWGKPAELVLSLLTGHDLNSAGHLTRYVQVGEMAGADINLKAATLRSSLIELVGAGGGGITKEIMLKLPTEILPQIFELAAEGIISIETEVVALKDVEQAWEKNDSGKRIVLVP